MNQQKQTRNEKMMELEGYNFKIVILNLRIYSRMERKTCTSSGKVGAIKLEIILKKILSVK